MAQNSEQIESKLCAYIEGELDERGRAEIEKHLQANPHHRKLLAELGETRRMMQALPRESAPPELYEAFQSQLERSVLLDYNDGRDEPAAYRINRFPQVFAAAAIVMLAVGLGLIVYFALPITTTRTEVVSDGPSLATAPALGEESAVVPPWTSEDRDPRHGRGADVVHEAEALAAGTPPGGASTFDKAGNGSDAFSPNTGVTPGPGTTLPADAPRLPLVAEQLRNVAGGEPEAGLFAAGSMPLDRSSPEPVVVVVSALDPGAADSTLRRALARIPDATWADATPARRPLPLATGDVDAVLERQRPEEETEVAAAKPETAVRHRMLRQATDVLLRSEVARADTTPAPAVDEAPVQKTFKRDADEALTQLDQPAEHALADPATAPAKPSDRKGGAAGSGGSAAAAATSAPAVAQRPAPVTPQAAAGAAGPATNPKADSAKRDEWALDGGFKESSIDSPKGPANDESKSLAENEPRPAPAPASEPADAAPGEAPAATVAADGASLSTAYRVIVAQNVPRSQVEVLRRELRESAEQQVAVYGVQSDHLKDIATGAAPADAPSDPSAAGDAGTATALSDSKSQAAPAMAGEAAKQGNAASTAAVVKQEVKKSAESIAPTTAASPTPPAGGQTRATTALTVTTRLDVSKDRTVRVGDTLRVSVASAEPGKPPVEQDVRIADDGTLTLAQAGEAVYSDGLTVAELERHLETTLARQTAPAPSTPAPAPLGARNAQPAARVASTPRVTIATVTAPAPAPAPAAPSQVAQMPARSEQPLAKAADAAPLAVAKPAAPPATLPGELADHPVATAPVRGFDTPGSNAAAAAESDQRVEVVFVVRQAPAATSGPVPPPAAAAIENSDILTVTVDDPANPTTTNVRVAEDGTVDVPLAGKVKAVGRTTTQLESDIEARWRESKASVAPGTKAKVGRPTDDPAAAPAIDTAPAKQ